MRVPVICYRSLCWPRAGFDKRRGRVLQSERAAGAPNRRCGHPRLRRRRRSRLNCRRPLALHPRRRCRRRRRHLLGTPRDGGTQRQHFGGQSRVVSQAAAAAAAAGEFGHAAKRRRSGSEAAMTPILPQRLSPAAVARGRGRGGGPSQQLGVAWLEVPTELKLQHDRTRVSLQPQCGLSAGTAAVGHDPPAARSAERTASGGSPPPWSAPS